MVQKRRGESDISTFCSACLTQAACREMPEDTMVQSSHTLLDTAIEIAFYSAYCIVGKMIHIVQFNTPHSYSNFLNLEKKELAFEM